MLWVEPHAEFVVAAAEVLDECVSGTDHAGRAEPFEATHRPESGLESFMIGLDGHGMRTAATHRAPAGRPVPGRCSPRSGVSRAQGLG